MEHRNNFLDKIQNLINFRINPRSIVIIHDLTMIVVAWLSSWLIRFNLHFPFQGWETSIKILPIVIIVQSIILWKFKLYRGIWRFASVNDLWNIIKASLLGALCITLILFILIRLTGIPRTILVLYPIFLVCLLGGSRFGYRLIKDYSFNYRPSITTGTKTLIIGAGRAGEMIIRDMLRDGSYTPIGILDDNKKLKKSEIHGIRVLGPIEIVENAVKEYQPERIVIAIPSANNQEMRRIIHLCENVGMPILTLPKLSEQVNYLEPSLKELRDVSIEDLLGREKVELDWSMIQSDITGKVVLVTGGGGSIGSELCVQIANLSPEKLIIYEQNEFNLYKITNKLNNKYKNLNIISVLGDICDVREVEYVFDKHTPDIVLHTAAYKHVPILQSQAREAVINNIFGTIYLTKSAIRTKVEKFIYISTDKAVNPVNVLGYTKRVSEIYCAAVNQKTDTKFITVRFGNVLGSDGSVVPLFQEQIRTGGPVTVTHPEISRYFMTIPEASQLILQAEAMGNGGEIFILDMGQPVKILYLANEMIKLSGYEPGVDIDIEFIGLRPGEKLHEELFYENEIHTQTLHKKILLSNHYETDFELLNKSLKRLEKVCEQNDNEQILSILTDLTGIKYAARQSKNNIIRMN